MQNKSGIVIILNGPSVSGKSSIQKNIQEKMKEPFMVMGIDSILVAMMPQRYFLGQEEDRKEVLWGEGSKDEEGNPLFHLHFGPKGRRVMFGMHEAIASFARNGNNVIVDYIQYEKEWMPHLVKSLEGIKTCFVKIDLPLEVLETREKERATSPVGHARSHYYTVYDGASYDLSVDTSRQTPEECAEVIVEHVNKIHLEKERSII